MGRGKSISSGMRWKHNEDLILVETLTEFVSKGMNIQEAFPILPERLPGRTEKSCYARWSSYLEEIYGGALEIAKRKQQEHAQKVIESILNNQGELQVVHPNQGRVELIMPDSTDLVIDSQQAPIPIPMSSTITDIHTAIRFLNDMANNYDNLKRENEQMLEELERAWNENEQIKMELAAIKGEGSQYHVLKELANKLESVKL